MREEQQVSRIVDAVKALPSAADRIVIAVAGPPAAGKSTVAEGVQQRLEKAGIPCALVPMDGFHLDNSELEGLGLLSRKGSAQTFDLAGFTALLESLTTEDEVSVPLFDRAKDKVLPAARMINARHRHVVVEGNYLFLDEPGWRDLARFWTLSVFIAPSLEVLRARLLQRWLDHGLSAETAEERAEGNDLPNARHVLENSNRTNIDLMLT